MAKYKVGDKVRVRTDLKINAKFHNVVFVNAMEEYRGQELIIRDVFKAPPRIPVDVYHVQGMGWTWTEEMFEDIVGNSNAVPITPDDAFSTTYEHYEIVLDDII